MFFTVVIAAAIPNAISNGTSQTTSTTENVVLCLQVAKLSWVKAKDIVTVEKMITSLSAVGDVDVKFSCHKVCCGASCVDEVHVMLDRL